MLRKYACVFAAVVLAAGGCQSAEDRAAAEEASRQAALAAARADSVLEAETQYDAAAFDSIAWENSEARFERGSVVWSFSCAKCHGAGGQGGGEMAEQHELSVPSLLAADWALAGDLAAIRRGVFVGHESEMPSWGLYGLAYRDVDAVAFYIVEGLRAQAEAEAEG
jgi:mono/diheme cytochrome c family protein